MQECVLVVGAYGEKARITSCLDCLDGAAIRVDFRWREDKGLLVA